MAKLDWNIDQLRNLQTHLYNTGKPYEWGEIDAVEEAIHQFSTSATPFVWATVDADIRAMVELLSERIYGTTSPNPITCDPDTFGHAKETPTT